MKNKLRHQHKYLYGILLITLLISLNACDKDIINIPDIVENKTLINTNNVEPYKIKKTNDRELYNTVVKDSSRNNSTKNTTNATVSGESISDVQKNNWSTIETQTPETVSDDSIESSIIVPYGVGTVTIVGENGDTHVINMQDEAQRKMAAAYFYVEETPEETISQEDEIVGDITIIDYINNVNKVPTYDIQMSLIGNIINGTLYNIPESLLNNLRGMGNVEINSNLEGIRETTEPVLPTINSISNDTLIYTLDNNGIYVDKDGHLLLTITQVETSTLCYKIGEIEGISELFSTVGPGLVNLEILEINKKMA